MNVYIVEDKELIISIDCNKARRYLSNLRKDKRYLKADEVEMVRLRQNEVNNVQILNDLTFNGSKVPLSIYLDEKVGIDIEIIEEDCWIEN